MTEKMWAIIDLLHQMYVERGRDGGYLAAWGLEDAIGVKFSGCGVPVGDPAIEKLVKMGLIEELPDLSCRFRIVVQDD